MNNDELVDALNHLQSELAKVDRLEPETADALARLTSELQRLADPEDATSTEDLETSSDGIRGYLLEFEVEHPRIAETLGRLADGLANMGI